MSFTKDLFSLGTAGLLSSILKPKFHSGSAPKIDIQAETEKFHSRQMANRDEKTKEAMDNLRSSAVSMSRGEIPKEVLETMRRRLAERAVASGISANQLDLLNAQAIGQTQMDIISRGAELTGMLESIQENQWAVAKDSALGLANQQFEAYVMNENAKLAAFKQDAMDINSLVSGFLDASVYESRKKYRIAGRNNRSRP